MNEVSETLYEEVASFINFTWTDSRKEQRIKNFILSSASYLNYIAGTELVYEGEDADLFAKDLLFNRVLYADSQALDDFDKNYVNELNTLRVMHHAEENIE